MDPLVVAQVDLRAIAHNLKQVRNLIPKTTKIMAVVKANGYGHGAYEVAKVALLEGASSLAVARLDEAIDLREKGICEDILVFGYIPIYDIELALKYNLIATIFDKKQADEYRLRCRDLGSRLKVHIKVDTGMGRVGFVLSDKNHKKQAISDVREVVVADEFSVEGIYTHFACADEEDLSFSKIQLELFNELMEEVKKMDIGEIKFHAANSAAVMQLKDAHLDIVRPGIMLYGLYPSDYLKKSSSIKLMPAMTLKARITQIKEVSEGFRVSYGSTHVTKGKSRLATIPVGYADGYPRILSNKGSVLISGKLAKIVGRVCMDQFVVDVTHINVSRGDDVIIFGREGSYELSADKVARWANTINYEIVSQITSRVKRVYVKER